MTLEHFRTRGWNDLFGVNCRRCGRMNHRATSGRMPGSGGVQRGGWHCCTSLLYNGFSTTALDPCWPVPWRTVW